MKDTAILTLGPPGGAADAAFRNDVAEVEGRLRFILTGWHLAPVFGGEPCHPGDRLVTSLALGRLHLHHVVDAGACVLVLLLAGDVDARLAAEVVRYADARVRPPFPLFVLATREAGPGSKTSLLRVSGELRALGRAFDAADAPAIREDDPAFHDWALRLESTRDAVRAVRRDLRFHDDLRRHHHLSVCPGGSSPASWRLPPMQALVRCGITASTAGTEEVERRARWLLGSGPTPLDPRLVEIREAGREGSPGTLAENAVALAIRDLADERLAFSVALGPVLPAAARPDRVAAILNLLRAPGGRLVMPLCAAAGDDDAGALSQHLLQRAALPPPDGRPFLDPARAPVTVVAATFRVDALEDGHVLLAPPDGAAGAMNALAGGEATAARLGFDAAAPFAACFEAGRVEVAGGRLRVPVPGGAAALLAGWPSDRLALVRGRCAGRLQALLDGIGIPLTRVGPP